MKKNIYIALIIMAVGICPSCHDFLEPRSASTMDGDFITSSEANIRLAMSGLYETWRDCAQGKVFGDGMWYGADVPKRSLTSPADTGLNVSTRTVTMPRNTGCFPI